MNIITLNVYSDTAKHEILEFLKKFNSQEAEIKQEITNKPLSNLRNHPFFGMSKNNQETVEETLSHLRGSRY
jgi:hypothetical protein